MLYILDVPEFKMMYDYTIRYMTQLLCSIFIDVHITKFDCSVCAKVDMIAIISNNIENVPPYWSLLNCFWLLKLGNILD